MLFPNFSGAVMAIAALAITTNAAPPRGPPRGPPGPPASPSLVNLAAKMPQNTLPAPTGLELKYVLLGLGTQNYTCTTGDDTVEPDTTGAIGNFHLLVYLMVTNN